MLTRNNIKALVLGSSLTMLGGCASIVGGTHENVSVDTTPEHAACKLASDEGTWFVSNTPGSVMIDRGYGDLTVSCHEDNYSGVTTVKSTTKGMAFGNILAGGLIGAAIDMGTGAAYEYPSMIIVPLILQSNS